jgi:SNF2 family DNA or RNA helicase
MSLESPDFKPGQKVLHPEFGEGIVSGILSTGFITVFFQAHGERQVPPASLNTTSGWIDRIVSGSKPCSPDALEKLWLAIEAAELPLLESAAILTSAKVDLLPHQVVLVHRFANTQPRRFLIADEVGLGKTIETALILRELASRGELERALMIVPAGLVENWRRELNDVFNLDFEVFGSEGDVTDRKTNAFAKHNRMIVSVDTLKRRPRIRRLLDAPQWDLVVFDEAHHLSVYKNGKKVSKTENFKLAEAIREHSRDLLLLSATPHQGDHFRFWMLIRLLNPSLFSDEEDMVQNRHRLNAAVIRRTKADACASDGSPLFARRVVHTQGFELSPQEKAFYAALLEYLRDGYNLAAMQGNKGRALGFVMTIFQKIAASSFAAVKATLQRRLLMLTIREAIERDEVLDVDGRDKLLSEARGMLVEMNGLKNDAIGKAQADQLLAEAKVQLLKRKKETEEYIEQAESLDDFEIAADQDADVAALTVAASLPEERQRITALLSQFPQVMETKTSILLSALRDLWNQNPREKIVIFTTYLGSISGLKAAIEAHFPDKGVEVLKGGDHGSKTAAQKRFKRENGPCVLLSTAAGREGINLQFSRILFNHDLPWNPMDLEQRIGRIHRYGQKYTAQVYNLVATDTIEGQIFLLLEDKLKDIAEALGKVDEQGNITEDLRSQILGQLAGRLSYDQLYKEAIQDPTLVRTRQELEVAMTNASLAREVVFQLFQDLDKFNINEYKKFDDQGRGMDRLVRFVSRSAGTKGISFKKTGEEEFEYTDPAQKETVRFTSNRDKALNDDKIELLGLEHPIINRLLVASVDTPPEARSLIASFSDNGEKIEGVLTFWQVTIHGGNGQIQNHILRLSVNRAGLRLPKLERLSSDILSAAAPNSKSAYAPTELKEVLEKTIPEILYRELEFRGLLQEGDSYSAVLLGCVEIE